MDLYSFRRLGTGLIIAGVLSAVPFQNAPATQDQPNKEAQGRDGKGMPPRATPADYNAHAKAGEVTLAAEFGGHSVPTPQSVLATEDYVAVEVALFGPPEGHTVISIKDFSLRINEKKSVLPAQPYSLTFGSLKDPEWAPPEPVESKSKTSLGSGGQGNSGDKPAPVHPPFALQRTWQLAVQKAALPEGDRLLPAAGLIFFRYSGQAKGIYSVELIYSGPAGKASLNLHP